MKIVPIIDHYFFEDNIQNSEEVNKEIIEYLTKKKQNQKNNKYEIGSSKREDLILSSEEYNKKPFINLIYLILEKINKGSKKYAISSLWGMVQHPGQSCCYHDHDQYTQSPKPTNIGTVNNLSFVYYLNKNENDGILKFPFSIYQNKIIYNFEGKKGDLLFFPSWLPHYVTLNESNEDRVLLSGNLICYET